MGDCFNMSEGNIDQNILEKSDLETIGCFFKGYSILWTNPSPEKSLRKFCSELKVELKEILNIHSLYNSCEW